MPAAPTPRSDNRSRFAILGALSICPMSGYDLRRFFGENLGYFWSESFGQIYPMLRALAGDGLAEPVPDAPGRRKPYRITDAGRQALGDWVEAPVAPETGRVEILLKLFFAAQGTPAAVAAHLQHHRATHEARLARYAEVRREIETDHPGHPHLVYWLATLSYGVHTSRAMLAWCDEVDATLTRAPTPGAPTPPAADD